MTDKKMRENTDELEISAEDMELSPYDTAEYLCDEEAVKAYWEAVQEEASDDPVFVLKALATIARARNINALAKQAGISRQGLYKALSSNGNPRYETVAKLATALGLKLELHPVKAAGKAA